MKIVIDIPIEAFNYIKDNKQLVWLSDCELAEAIANGTPLPKNHGDLITEIDKLPRIKVGNSNSPTVKYCIDEVLLYDLLENMPSAEKK